jgi:hypothetical protein
MIETVIGLGVLALGAWVLDKGLTKAMDLL